MIRSGTASVDFGGRNAGADLTNTFGAGDYLRMGTQSFALGYRLAPWLDMYGPSAGLPDPIPPDGAVLEWEFEDPEPVALAAAGDEDLTVTQTCVLDSPVNWRIGGSLDHFHATWDPTHLWQFVYGVAPDGDLVTTYRGGLDGWNDITSAVDFDALLDSGGFDLIANANTGLVTAPTVAKPGSDSYVRFAQFLALRLSLRARRYRWVYERPQVTRQYPRDDGYGLVGGPRLYPPPRRGRVFGGQQ
jgi:hypothetical protein